MPRTQDGLARRRAQPAGELREVVGRVEPVHRAVPVVAPDEVVPLRDDVAQRAALVAERDAAVHAAPGLGGDDRQQGAADAVGIDLVPVVDALGDSRREATSRPCLRKPFGSAMQHLHDASRGLVLVEALLEGLLTGLEHALEVARHHLGEAGQRRVPVGQQRRRDLGAGLLGVLLDERPELVGGLAGRPAPARRARG